VPKHHAGGFLLEVKQVQAAANFSMIVCSEHRLLSVGRGRARKDDAIAATPCRSSAGLVSWAISRWRAYAQTKPSPPKRVVIVVVVRRSRAAIEGLAIRASNPIVNGSRFGRSGSWPAFAG
jgi:hypothetical protein